MNDTLYDAACRGDLEAVSCLLADDCVGAHAHAAIASAASNGFVDVVRALLADGRADPATQSSRALINAAERGHTDVVAALLADGRARTQAQEAAKC
jgi:hypothetical protein